MKLKLLQLNIWRGRFIKNIIDYINKESFDICTFQEVTKHLPSYDLQIDCFAELQRSLSLSGTLHKNLRFQENPNSHLGLATFYNPKLKLVKKESVEFRPYAIIPRYPDGDIRWETIPNSALATELNFENNKFKVINVHGAWSKNPKDTPEKIRQGKILFEYVKNLKTPFILSGDFNLETNTQTLKMFETVSTNLIRKYGIKNTLNAQIHKAKYLFPPGIAADHIFISQDIQVHKYQVIDSPDLSDHLGISMEFGL